jgi:hypothetical protein
MGHRLLVVFLTLSILLPISIPNLSAADTSTPAPGVTIYVKPHNPIEVAVSGTFTLDLYVRVDGPNGLARLDLQITWLGTLMEFVSEKPTPPPGWSFSSYTCMGSSPPYVSICRRFEAPQGQGWIGEQAWHSITFHCLSVGTSTITYLVTVYETGSSEPSGTGELGLAVNQVSPRTVGGLVMPTNKLEILAPYLH